MQAVSGQVGPEAASAAPPGPELPPQPADIERVMDKVQKRDNFHIFKEPVTDAMVRLQPQGLNDPTWAMSA